jgi:hypothetical protein
MKNTKIMLICISSFILSWIFCGVIGYLLTDNVTFKYCISHPATVYIMLLIGWFPALIIGHDLNNTIKN